MNPATEKMLNTAMDRINNTQVEAANFRKRGPNAVKKWKAFAKANPTFDSAEIVVKEVVPIIEKLLKKSKQLEQSLDKLQDAGDAPHDYYDGKEFRDRTKKLLDPASAFDADAAKVVLRLARFPSRLYPLMREADIKVTVDSLTAYMGQWQGLKLAINRI